MDMGISRFGAHGISHSTATNETPRIPVPGPTASHEQRQAFINALLPPGRQRFMLASLNEKQLARFVAYLRIKGVDPKDADAVARFINGYEQYCGEEPRPDRDGAVASLKEHIAKEPNAAELGAILNENTEQFADLLTGRAHWEFLNLPDRDGFTPLMRAVKENDEQLVGDLIFHGAEVDVDAMVVAVHHNMPLSLKKCLMIASEFERLLLPSRDGTSLLTLIAGRGDYECLDELLVLGRANKITVDLQEPMEHAADRGDWDMLKQMLVYLGAEHGEAVIPIPVPALGMVVRSYVPSASDPRKAIVSMMFKEAMLRQDLEGFDEIREIFRQLVNLAQKDRALVVDILRPLTRSGITISELIGYDVPGLVGLMVEAGGNIREVTNDGDLLETAMGRELSLATIEEVLMGFTAAGVAWNDNFCLHLAMDIQSQALGSLLVKYGAVIPTLEIYEWLHSPAHLS